MELYDVSFNGFQLNNGDFSSVMIHDFDQMPNANKNIAPVSTSHFSLITSKYYVTKTVTITLLTRGCFDKISAKTAMIRKTLQGKYGELILHKYVPTLNSSVYEYNSWTSLKYKKATLDSIDFDTQGINSVVTAIFTVLTPIGAGGTDQTLYSGNVTSTPLTVDLTMTDIQGTFDTQYPIYTLEFGIVITGSNPSISFSNEYNILTYSGEVSYGDTLVVDTTLENMGVYLNGEQVDFTGSFPTLNLSGSILSITDTYTSRDVDVTITNTPRYI